MVIFREDVIKENINEMHDIFSILLRIAQKILFDIKVKIFFLYVRKGYIYKSQIDEL